MIVRRVPGRHWAAGYDAAHLGENAAKPVAPTDVGAKEGRQDMHVVVIYESLTGNTRRAAELIGVELARTGHQATVCSTAAIDYQALSTVDLVIVGSWTDGVFFVGQRPGRAARLRHLPVMDRMKAVVFCTYALDPGHTLSKLTAIIEERGAKVLGGLAIRRNDLEGGARELVGRLLEGVEA